MTDIELHAKSDRELLIMLVDKVNTSCAIIQKHDKSLYGNGLPGLVFQAFALWICVALLATDNPHVQRILCIFWGR